MQSPLAQRLPLVPEIRQSLGFPLARAGTIRTAWACLTLVPVALLGLFSGAAQADFMSVTNVSEPPKSDKLFIDAANKGVSSFQGFVGGQSNSFPIVNVTTSGKVDTGSGWSNITPGKGGTLTTLTLTPVDPKGFNAFNFRGQLLSAGTLTVTVQDNQGDAPQSFNFTISKANQDFGRIGITAIPGSVETIKSVTLSDSGGFKEVKQIGFTDPKATPEPSSFVLAAIAGLGLSVWGIRHRRRRLVLA